MNEICTRADVQIREALADFACEINKSADVDELTAIWNHLRHIEKATQQLVDSAAAKSEATRLPDGLLYPKHVGDVMKSAVKGLFK